ncbi:GNAT family N-acetyltransferase [Anoxynatronum buryatiense]|uniref:Protein N-acetyltransferase, RimJ/RimL family n=1 Tax=Anoxynatronum buryatiense TaxID=489973 RepID=A0AA45WXZ9_9CLOT|nr:GNAT family protein [Anoxynatronum buryatiense]SMP66389.1 Protein N-acetyltransferase, RimJ/RimL family [Anoxynatronum buryatiense]
MVTAILKSGQKVNIMKAVEADAAALIAYMNQISRESDNLTFGPGELNITKKEEAHFIRSVNSQPNALFLVAVVENRIIGNLHFTGGNRPRTAHAGEFGMSVLREFWGQGLGSALLERLIVWAKGTGTIRKINLRVRTDNVGAIRLYHQTGFQVEGIITREFKVKGQYYDLMSMGLKLD